MLREAELELDEAFEWYEQQREGLGTRFMQQVDDGLAFIYQQPSSSQKVRGEVRRHVIDTFPFGIYYTFDAKSNHIIVIACLHFSRNPKIWKTRRTT